MNRQIMTIVYSLILSFGIVGLLFAGGRAEPEVNSNSGVIAIEYWNESSEGGKIDADHPQSRAFAEQFGIVWDAPQISWNSGNDYLQQLRLRIASGDLPDVFMPWGGIEAELIENGVVADLTELVQQEMPIYFSNVPEEVWQFIKSLSPDGESIYILPAVQFTPLCAMIRGDWLDRLGLEVPTTTNEYVEVLRAFRDQDANGNGDPNDEYPTSGREGGRWMDHLFAPFGVAMREGLPDWDIYDGELQYSGVQPEMKDAIEWVRGLYAEGLLDNETFINNSTVSRGKIIEDRVGSFYFGLHWADSRFVPLYNSGVTSVRLDYLPLLESPNHNGYLTSTVYRRPGNMFSAAMQEEAIRRTMRALEWLNDPANQEEVLKGWEGVEYIVENGREVRLSASDFLARGTGYRVSVLPQLYASAETQLGGNLFSMSLIDPESSAEQFAVYQGLNTENKLVEAYASNPASIRSIVGQFVPASVYDGYPDIRNHRLFQEYLSKIIVGEWELDRFDEFVEIWYESGGDEVTVRAQEAYDRLTN